MNQIPPAAYVAWRAGTTTLFLLVSLSPQIVKKFQDRKGTPSPISAWTA
jgi:hypothetical protein